MYEGETKDGQGTFIYDNGDKYVGEFKDGRRHGQGTFTAADGDKYVGEWRDGERHGRGTASFPNGNQYVGEWKDDRFTAQDIVSQVESDRYFGPVEKKNFLKNLLRETLWWTFKDSDFFANEYGPISSFSGEQIRDFFYEASASIDTGDALSGWTWNHPEMPKSGVGSSDFIHVNSPLSRGEIMLLSDAWIETMRRLVDDLPWNDAPEMLRKML